MDSRLNRNAEECLQYLCRRLILTIFHPIKTRNKLLASALEHQNIAQCATHNALPPELILQIVSTLNNADFLLLKYACRWFSALLQQDTAKRIIGTHDRKTIVNRLKFDAFLQQAAAEITTHDWSLLPWIKRPHTLLCRSCLEAHPSTAFTLEERQQPPTVRRCIGSSSLFHAFNHQSFFFAQLRAMLSDANLQATTDRLSICHAPNLPHDNRYRTYLQRFFTRIGAARQSKCSVSRI
jgi:hypothetical protein